MGDIQAVAIAAESLFGTFVTDQAVVGPLQIYHLSVSALEESGRV
jgi:hypothetical protein